MFLNDYSNICLIIIFYIVNQISGLAVSYNQPKFCSDPSWNPNGITFADISIVGLNPQDIFINTNNTVFVPNQEKGQIVVLSEGSTTPTRIISGNLINPFSLFVTTSDDIYVDAYDSIGGVSKWTLNTNINTVAMYVDQKCMSLFVDINNTLYCSMTYRHQVIKKWLDDNAATLVTVAGTGSSGSASDMLNQPHGIFVDTNFDLYVADCSNNRIQLFQLGQLTATTVAGSGSSTTTITLNGPTGIVLDADKYLFIADNLNNRIVGSGPNGFRCLVGCSGTAGSASNQFNWAQSLSFDSHGNMFVIDVGNNRIQKFVLSTNLCNPQTTTSTLAMSMTTTLTTKIYVWPNSTSSANDYSHNYYIIFFFFYFNYIIIL